MKKRYMIYDAQTDEIIGYVYARTVIEAEIEGSAQFNRYTNEICALCVENY